VPSVVPGAHYRPQRRQRRIRSAVRGRPTTSSSNAMITRPGINGVVPLGQDPAASQPQPLPLLRGHLLPCSIRGGIQTGSAVEATGRPRPPDELGCSSRPNRPNTAENCTFTTRTSTHSLVTISTPVRTRPIRAISSGMARNSFSPRRLQRLELNFGPTMPSLAHTWFETFRRTPVVPVLTISLHSNTFWDGQGARATEQDAPTTELPETFPEGFWWTVDRFVLPEWCVSIRHAWLLGT
jgi:hypothetical protein